jgi:uncharacterized membrane protein
VIAFLATAVAATVLLRAQLIAGKSSITHDDTIAYISATCHQGEFHRADYGPDPVPAASWKKFTKLDRRFCFGAIASGLRDYDIHPPLYFWLLHIWFLIFGVTVWSGATLNLLVSAITVVSLFGLSRYLLKDDLEAALVVTTFALSSAVVSISVEARPYDLLGLLAVLAVWATTRATDPHGAPRRHQLVLLAIAMAAGSLTHYHFLFIVAACLAVVAVRLVGRDRKRWVKTSAAILFGYLIGFLIHPPLGLFGRASLHNEPFDVGGLAGRWAKVAVSFEAFAYLLVPCVVIAAALTAYSMARRRNEPHQRFRIDLRGLWVLLVALWICAVTVTLFLSFLSPSHAMSPKYLVTAWPFLAFLAVLLYRMMPLNEPTLFYLLAVPVLFGLVMPSAGPRTPQRMRSSSSSTPEEAVFSRASFRIFPTTRR